MMRSIGFYIRIYYRILRHCIGFVSSGMEFEQSSLVMVSSLVNGGGLLNSCLSRSTLLLQQKWNSVANVQYKRGCRDWKRRPRKDAFELRILSFSERQADGETKRFCA